MSNVLIIGLGSAGLMAMSLLKESSVAIERNSEAGLKLLISGGGRCNFSPSFSEIENHYYDKTNFVKPALLTFPPNKIRDYLRSLGVESKVEGLKLFPTTDKAVTIRDALLKGHGPIHYSERVISIEKSGDLFTLKTEKSTYEAKYVIVATGGITIPQTGSDGSLFPILRKLGHSIVPPKASLSELIIKNNILSEAEGISLKITLKKGKEETSGDAVITRNGISGPSAENFSHYIEGDDEVQICFLKIEREDLNKLNGKAMLKNALNLPERLITSLFPTISNKRIADLSKEEREIVIKSLNSFKVNVSVNGKSAMCTRGGVSVKEINRKTMESRIIPNLYIIGEALDVDGECGGFNIAWAFSSAFLAAEDILRKLHLEIDG